MEECKKTDVWSSVDLTFAVWRFEKWVPDLKIGWSTWFALDFNLKRGPNEVDQFPLNKISWYVNCIQVIVLSWICYALSASLLLTRVCCTSATQIIYLLLPPLWTSFAVVLARHLSGHSNDEVRFDKQCMCLIGTRIAVDGRCFFKINLPMSLLYDWFFSGSITWFVLFRMFLEITLFWSASWQLWLDILQFGLG